MRKSRVRFLHFFRIPSAQSIQPFLLFLYPVINRNGSLREWEKPKVPDKDIHFFVSLVAMLLRVLLFLDFNS